MMPCPDNHQANNRDEADETIFHGEKSFSEESDLEDILGNVTNSAMTDTPLGPPGCLCASVFLQLSVQFHFPNNANVEFLPGITSSRFTAYSSGHVCW